jgi:hypothetical protein
MKSFSLITNGGNVSVLRFIQYGSVSHLMSFLTAVRCRFCVGQFELDSLRREFNKQNKKVAQLKIVSNFNQFLSFNLLI